MPSAVLESIPNPHPLPPTMHSARYGAAVVGGAAFLACCHGLSEGRQSGRLKPAKVILMFVIILNIAVLAFALVQLGEKIQILESSYGFSVDSSTRDLNSLINLRIASFTGLLLEVFFLVAFFYLDNLLLTSVHALLVTFAAVGVILVTLRLHYPPLWIEVILCCLMALCSLLMLLDFAEETKARQEAELRRRRRSSTVKAV